MARKNFTLGGHAVLLAPLSFRQLAACKDDINKLTAPAGANYTDPEARDAVTRVLKVSATAGGTPLDDDFLLDHLNTYNFSDVITAIFDRNGFLAGPEDDAGEATAIASPR